MTYDELMNIEPQELTRRNMHNRRQAERRWEQTRAIVAAIYDTNSNRRIKPTDVVKLGIDESQPSIDISNDEINKLKTAWGLS